MNLAQKPNLKPFRNYSEWQKINGLYALNATSGNKGTFVSIITATGNTNVFNVNTGDPITPHVGRTSYLPSPSSRFFAPTYGVTWLVGVVPSGTAPVLGCLLNDVREFNQFGENLRYRPEYERAENMYVLPGESVPILKYGIIHTNNFSGTPGINSGAYVHNGVLVVSPYNRGYISHAGKFMSTPDKDGYALFDIEL